MCVSEGYKRSSWALLRCAAGTSNPSSLVFHSRKIKRILCNQASVLMQAINFSRGVLASIRPRKPERAKRDLKQLLVCSNCGWLVQEVLLRSSWPRTRIHTDGYVPLVRRICCIGVFKMKVKNFCQNPPLIASSIRFDPSHLNWECLLSTARKPSKRSQNKQVGEL